MSYTRFAAMIATSTVVMFALMYLNLRTRPRHRHPDAHLNGASDRRRHYMKAMIPHHSISILTSERAHIRDPRVR